MGPANKFNLGYFFSRVNSPLCNIDPENTAVKYLDKSLSYRELNKQINKVANGLLSIGAKKRFKTCLLAYNCIEFFEIFYAVAKIGGIFIPLNFRLVAEELKHIINHSEAEAIIYGPEFKGVIDEIRSDLKYTKKYICLEEDRLANDDIYSEIINYQSDHEPKIDYDVLQNDLQMIMYTSGTTGLPKGVMFTHSQLLWSAASQSIAFSYNSKDVTLLTGPLYHVGALVDLSIGTTNMGGTNVIFPSLRMEIEDMLETMETNNVTNLLLFPIMVIRMLNLPGISRFKLKSLRFAIVGGERIEAHLLQGIQDKWPWVKLYQAYGLTEGSEFTSLLDANFAIKKVGSIGKAFYNVDIRIVDNDGKDVEVGEIGEIINRSPATRGGYWKDPEATSKTFADGWCHTGDLGRIDHDGFLYIAGRKKEMIRSAGENIYASEVESAIMKRPEIFEVAVYPVPHPLYTEAVMAAVVLKKGAKISKEELLEHCKKYLASYKKPKYIDFIDSLPRTASNKVKKFILQKKYEDIALR